MHPLSYVAIAAVLGALVYSVWRKAPLSLTLALAILVVFLMDFLSMTIVSGPNPVFFDLAWDLRFPVSWTFASSIFVHAGTLHLMFNLLGFVLITPILEDRIGSLRWAVVFFTGAALGHVAFGLLHAGEGVILVGASGGLLAVLGAFARLYPRDRVTLFLPIPGFPTIPVIWLALGFIVFSFFLVAFSPAAFGAAHESHLVGIAFGFAAAPAVLRIPSGGRRPREVNDAVLDPLATTRVLRQILQDFRGSDVPEVREAWLEKFASAAKCPRCEGPLRLRRSALTSRCGWRLRL